MGFEYQKAEHRVTRGRQIVARQREIVAACGTPMSVALLATFERSLAAFEEDLARCHHDGILAVGAERSGGLGDTEERKMVYQARSREVARIIGILREGGYACELAQPTLH